jgi:2-polyprenyl-3-methyl-5-hydroxy-6-metoxy-1,4-benzoquinol methylase
MHDNPFSDAPLLPVESARCGMCGMSEGVPYAVSYDYEYGTCRNTWQFVQCTGCSAIYLNPRPAREALRSVYPPHYYSYNYDQRIGALARRGKEWMDRRALRWMIGHLDVPLSAYLDVGCGDGRYLRMMATFGLSRDRIYGVELEEQIVDRLAREGFQMEMATIEDARTLPDGHFQLLTMFSVLEHVADPARLLERACALLSPGGLLVAEVPNPLSLNARWFRDRYWGGYHTPRHWNLFTLETLTAAATRAGLRLKAYR